MTNDTIRLDILNCREQIQKDIIARLSLPISIRDYIFTHSGTAEPDVIDDLCEIVVKNFKPLIAE